MGRRALEHRLEAVVADNRFTIAVVFPLIGATLLVASAEGLLPEWLAYNPILVLTGIAVMRLPLIAAVVPVIDRQAGVGILGLVLFTYTIEFVGLTTGWPYGEFSYLVDLGPMLAGVPIGLPLFYLPLVFDAYLLGLLLLGDRPGRIVLVPVSIATVLLIDLVLDPGAVAIGFWAYAAEGVYYGIPVSNYAGWLLSGTVAVLLVDLTIDRPRLQHRVRSCPFALDDLVSFVLLWGVINLLYLNTVPVLIAIGILIAVLRAGRFDLPSFRSMRLTSSWR
jgi:putative membrane protein